MGAHGIYAEPLDVPVSSTGTNTARRGSIGFQFQTPDAMLGSVLKYKDLKEVVVMEMGVIELEFYHNLQHVTLKLTTADAEARDMLLKSIEQFSWRSRTSQPRPSRTHWGRTSRTV